MFNRAGRQLAILNTVVVIALIAVLGILLYISLSRSLNLEVDRSLRERIEAVQLPDTEEEFLMLAEDPGSDEEPAERPGIETSENVISSGDTILMIADADGRVIENPRSVFMDDLPAESGLNRALNGSSDVRTVTLDTGNRVRVMSVPIYSDEQVIGVAQSIRSVTDLEDRLARLRWIVIIGIALGVVIAAPVGFYLSRRAMVPINAAFDRQRAFVADASHELRTPITLIRANAELALLESDSPSPGGEVADELRGILGEVDRIDRLVADLLLLARLDSGDLEMNMELHDIADVIVEAAESMRPIFAEHDIELGIEVRGSCPVVVDAMRIQQVIRILLDNARKHTGAGGEVQVEVGCQDSAFVLVRDTGSGIPVEDVDRVFDRFFRADRSRHRTLGGSGLGLPIAKAIVESHGGNIELLSTPGLGTTVRFDVPAGGEVPEAQAQPR